MKRRFATTTVASADLIRTFAEEGLTWVEVYDKIIYDDEAKAIADRFVAEGYGSVPAATHVH